MLPKYAVSYHEKSLEKKYDYLWIQMDRITAVKMLSVLRTSCKVEQLVGDSLLS